MISSFFAALLALAAQDAPVSTSPTAPRTEIVAPPAVRTDGPVPTGAPADDYGLVAWCQGALRGHMELGETFKGTPDYDEGQHALGLEYLKGYAAALEAAPQSKAADGIVRAERAREAGYRAWFPALSATNRQTQAFTYLGWQLPGRCDNAAGRLSSSADLLGAALIGGAPAVAATPLPAAAPPTDAGALAPAVAATPLPAAAPPTDAAALAPAAVPPAETAAPGPETPSPTPAATQP